MIKRFFLPILYILLISAVLVIAALNRKQAPAEIGSPVPMILPNNYRAEFSLYLVVDRPDETVRHIYAHPNVIAAIAAGQELPYGAQMIIETYHAQKDIFGNLQRDSEGHLIAGEMFPTIHMMEKREDWTIEDLPSPIGVIDWNFASFNTDGFSPSTENRNDCLTCHDGSAFNRDFLFSRPYLQAYSQSEEVQYLYCSLSGRGNCIR